MYWYACLQLSDNLYYRYLILPTKPDLSFFWHLVYNVNVAFFISSAAWLAVGELGSIIDGVYVLFLVGG